MDTHLQPMVLVSYLDFDTRYPIPHGDGERRNMHSDGARIASLNACLRIILNHFHNL